MLEVFSGRFLPPTPPGGKAGQTQILSPDETRRSCGDGPGPPRAGLPSTSGDSLGLSQHGARGGGLGGTHRGSPYPRVASRLASGRASPRLSGSDTALRSTYSVTTALLWPPARHTMSAMARARQWVLWVFEGCSCLRMKKETRQ